MASSALTVYSASAGSGKTFTLTIEYITLLLKDEQPQYKHILAVTFTNKATNEMKERIIKQLYGIANGLKSSDNYLKKIQEKIKLSEETIRQRAKNALYQIIHDYGNFRVETIDSFFQRIFSSLGYELHLPAKFQINIDDSEVKEYAVKNILSSVQEGTPLWQWLLRYINERIDENKRWNVTTELVNFSGQLFKERYLVNEPVITEYLEDTKSIHNYQQLLIKTKILLVEQLKVTTQIFVDVLLKENISYSDFSYGGDIEKYIEKCLQGIYDLNKTTIDEKVKVSNRLKTFMQDSDKWLRKEDKKNGYLQSVANMLSPLLADIENTRQQILEPILTIDNTLKNLHPLRILRAIDKEIKTFNAENNYFMLSHVAILLKRLASYSDASFIFEKSGIRFKHIMIDEFQDTSRIQWENFKHLFLENLSQGKSSILVGDGKQSIYRFREGDWTILQNINKELQTEEVSYLTLNTNYRSEAKIIAFNNFFFPKAIEYLQTLSDNEEQNTLLANLYADVIQEKPLHTKQRDEGYVKVSLVEEPQEDYLAHVAGEMLQVIDNLKQKGKLYSKMAIIVRTNKEASLLINYFNKHRSDIPFLSNQAFYLSNSMAVNLIIAGLRYLNDSTHTIALAFLVENYLQSNSKEKREGIGKKHLTEKELKEFLPSEFWRLQKELRFLPLFEIIQRLVHLFKLNTYVGEEPYLFAFLDETMARLGKHSESISSFLNYWDKSLCKKTIPEMLSEGITVITIHKSKGLEFDTVLMPYCNWALEDSGKKTNDLFWFAPSKAPFNYLPIVPIAFKKDLKYTIYKTEYEKEAFLQRVDSLNLLYVAFTRASKNLYVWGNYKEKKDRTKEQCQTVGELLKKVIVENEYETGQPLIQNETNERKEITRLSPILKEKEVDFLLYPIKAQFVQSLQATQWVCSEDGETPINEYLVMGNLMHNILQQVDTIKDIRTVIDKFEEQGYWENRLDKEEVIALLENQLLHSKAGSWFDGSWKLYKECSIVMQNEQGKIVQKRPDRVMKKGGQIIVVDFKFGKELTEHQKQVQSYMNLLKEIDSNAKIEGYLWYVLDKKIVKCKEK